MNIISKNPKNEEAERNPLITKVIKINRDEFVQKELEEAAILLRKGGLVAFPTETVYGLGADALNPEASSKIYAAKGRPSDNPLIAHIAEREDLYELVSEIPAAAEKLLSAPYSAGHPEPMGWLPAAGIRWLPEERWEVAG